MKDLLVFTENYARGGGNRYMIDMVNSLEADYQQVRLASNAGGIFSEDTRRLNCPVIQHEVPFITRSRISNHLTGLPKALRFFIAALLVLLEPLFFLVNIVMFVRLIRELRPTNILSCNGGYPAAQACLAIVVAARMLRVPVALSIVSMPAPRRSFMWMYEKLMDGFVWNAADVIVVNARAIADALCKLRDALPNKIEVVHNGLEDRQPIALAKKEGNQFVIGCIARMDVSKGVLLLFEAFARLARNHPEMRMVLAGAGDASAELARRTETLGLQQQVQLLGHYDGDVGALLASFDLYVFPSLWEGFPYGVVEAMRSGNVIVATRIGGIPEAITDGKEGLLITPGATDEIAAAIERLMADPAMRRELGHNARLRFESELALDKMHVRAREALSSTFRNKD